MSAPNLICTLYSQAQAAEFEQSLSAVPASCLSEEKRKYLTEFLRSGSTEFIKNGRGIKTAIAKVGNWIVPLVINDGKTHDCYLVSPYVHYILYMCEEFKKIKPKWASQAFIALLRSLGFVFVSLRFDRVTSINNWLFTTSLLCEPTGDEVRALTNLLRARFPTHALVFRGLDLRNKNMSEAFISNGFLPLIHRPVLEWDPRQFDRLPGNKRKQVRRDMRLIEGRPYRVETHYSIELQRAEEIATMYEKLYIVKHSRFNAHLSAKFFETVISTGMNFLKLFFLDGMFVGFATLCAEKDRTIACLTGYDQTVKQPAGSIYSAVFGSVFQHALADGKLLFLSTGVSSFKRRRGAYEIMEYEAFFVRHLHPFRRIPWVFMKRFLEFFTRSMDVSQI